MNYLPNNDDQLLQWLKNFSEQLPSTNVGVSQAEISSIKALIFDVKNDLRQGRNTKEENVLKQQKMLMFLNDLVEKMKNHPSYDKNIHGKKLGVE